VLDTDRKGLPGCFTKNGGDGRTGVYMREGTASRVMAAERPYCEFSDFYSVSPGYFGYSLVMLRTAPFYFGNVERKLHSEYINMHFPSMEGEILAFGISLCRGYYERWFNLLGLASGSAW
jgi:hypothetical protein